MLLWCWNANWQNSSFWEKTKIIREIYLIDAAYAGCIFKLLLLIFRCSCDVTSCFIHKWHVVLRASGETNSFGEMKWECEILELNTAAKFCWLWRVQNLLSHRMQQSLKESGDWQFLAIFAAIQTHTTIYSEIAHSPKSSLTFLSSRRVEGHWEIYFQVHWIVSYTPRLSVRSLLRVFLKLSNREGENSDNNDDDDDGKCCSAFEMFSCLQ